MRILLIDDDETNAKLLEAVLTKVIRGARSYEVTRVGRLFDALGVLDESAGFDAILLDLGLPECGGLTTLKLVRGHAPNVPVVVVTSAEDPAIEREAYRSGADGYLIKGRFHPAALEAALALACERRRPESASPELRGTFLPGEAG